MMRGLEKMKKKSAEKMKKKSAEKMVAPFGAISGCSVWSNKWWKTRERVRRVT